MLTLDDVLNEMPAEDRARVEARGKEILRAENIRELRRARRMSQAEMAKRMGRKQHDVSKIENRRDVLVSTIRDYVRGAGGELVLMAKMPGGDVVELTQYGNVAVSEVDIRPVGAKPVRERRGGRRREQEPREVAAEKVASA